MRWHEELHHKLDEVKARLDVLMAAVQRDSGSSSVQLDIVLSELTLNEFSSTSGATV